MFKWKNVMDINLHSKLNDSQILKHIHTLQKKNSNCGGKIPQNHFHRSLNSLMI
jgi:hypothetical protein